MITGLECFCSKLDELTPDLCQLHKTVYRSIDFPGHVLEGGKLSHDYSIEQLMGEGIIVEIPDSMKAITSAFVSQQAIQVKDIVFFKTANSALSKQAPFTEDYVYLKPDAAEILIERQVAIVGIDYISIDAYHAEDLPAHHRLLANEILIVENLELNDTESGRCHIQVLPLNIPNMDGLPARVVMGR